jgi:hypothetical protein
MDITAFVRELLFGHDCVIVPGFGGFIGNYTPARIDKSSGTFYPPVKQISFNRNLNHNDGLLVGRISGTSKMTYGDARTMVGDFVDEIKRKLEKGEKVVFDNIGSFSANQEGNIQFEPDKSANYYLDSFGLESFQCLPLEGYDVRKRILKHPGKDEARRASLRKNLWRAAVIIPLLSAIITVPLKTDLFKAKVESTTMNPLVLAEFENNKKAVDEEIFNSTKTEEISTNDPVNVAASEIAEPVSLPAENIKAESITPEVTAPVKNESGNYYLITGSFKTEHNAMQQVKMLELEGFRPEVVAASNGFFRVSAMMCSDLNMAVTRKDSISKKFPGTWISRKK